MEESVRPTHYPGQPPGGQGQLPGVSLPGLQPNTPLPGVPAPNGCNIRPTNASQVLAMQTIGGTKMDPADPNIGSPSAWNDVGSIRSGSNSTRYRHISQGPPPPPKKSWKKQFADGFRATVAFVFSKVGICVLVIGYLFVGAAMFQQLEGPEEAMLRFPVAKYRSKIVKDLWKITEEYNTLHPTNWTDEVTQIMKDYQTFVVKEAKEGYDGFDIPKPKWTFTGALLYSITVITTIGYGHIAPTTPVGKLVTIFYAIFGIPLFLLYLSNIGDIMATTFKWIYSRLCKCQRDQKTPEQIPSGILKKPDAYRVQMLPQHVHGLSQAGSGLGPEESTSSMASGMIGSEYSDEFQQHSRAHINAEGAKISIRLEDVTVPISLCLLVMVAYIFGGALLFSQWEGWGYLDGSYFCFITLSTIGFGDMVPGDAIEDSTDEDDLTSILEHSVFNEKFVLCSLYILLGMALIAMCFNLMQEKVVKGVRSLGRRLASKKPEVTEEQG